MNEKKNFYWVESENVAGCECCAWYHYFVYGFDSRGEWVEYGPYSYQDLADDKVKELESEVFDDVAPENR